MKNINERDLVFPDPPYTVSHNDNGFIIMTKKITGRCHLCGEVKPLIKAHIINKSIIERLTKGSAKQQALLLMPGATYKQDELVHDYFYDCGILCRDCDNSYSVEEEYFSSFLNGSHSKTGLIEASNTHRQNYNLISYNNFDYSKFKLALLFLLWKSSISEYKAFKKFKLDAGHERLIKQILFTKGYVASHLFSFEIYSFEKVDSELANMIKPFTLEKDGNISAALILFPNYLFLIFLTNHRDFYVEELSDEKTLYIREIHSEIGIEIIANVHNVDPKVPFKRILRS